MYVCRVCCVREFLFRLPPIFFPRQVLALASDRDWSNAVVVASDELYFFVWTSLRERERTGCLSSLLSLTSRLFPFLFSGCCTVYQHTYYHKHSYLRRKEWAKELSMVSKFVYKLASETESGLKFLVSWWRRTTVLQVHGVHAVDSTALTESLEYDSLKNHLLFPEKCCKKNRDINFYNGNYYQETAIIEPS